MRLPRSLGLIAISALGTQLSGCWSENLHRQGESPVAMCVKSGMAYWDANNPNMAKKEDAAAVKARAQAEFYMWEMCLKWSAGHD
jgi:hypothetical protein